LPHHGKNFNAMTTSIQQNPLSADAFEGYEGKWIAVRDGEVIASADSLQELRAEPQVTPDDAVYVVPEAPSYFF
jgi:hypothetical protein